ncbi:peptidylglycine alpha-hydroxylating monooxygenase-like [Acanthaster planci]|uniref:peptidylglycine monooxygenase n=1 Tax=Acanthaster planci TaxID=133434 RepID=A0A8B7Z1W8_ACAPL|nr:peptidylglycine alpha-hydroxylating monooxygenase-like [Acanthaster planci]
MLRPIGARRKRTVGEQFTQRARMHITTCVPHTDTLTTKEPAQLALVVGDAPTCLTYMYLASLLYSKASHTNGILVLATMADAYFLGRVSLVFVVLVAVSARGLYPGLNYYYALYGDYPEYFDASSSSDVPEEGLPYVDDNGRFEYNLTMPGVRPPKPDTYYCYSMPLSDEVPVFIVGYQPLAQKMTAHHMILFGCAVPGGTDTVWNCGEMAGTGDNPPCLMGEKIQYAWAMDAPPLKLPNDVGFEVGGNTGINYLVLQVHYNNVDKFKDGTQDFSGIGLQMTFRPQDHLAGVYFMVTNDGEIKANTETKLEAACEYQDSSTLYPFAYRVHTHKLGKVVSGYRIRDDNWEEVGKRNPQLPQMFYPVSNPGSTIEKGDTLAMRCTFEGDKDKDTYIGSTTKDEMCNFYIMFYTKKEPMPEFDTCIDYDYHWVDHLKNIPDKQASTLPDPPESE